MSVGTLVATLFEKLDNVFTSDQQKVIELLKKQKYSPVESCRRILPTSSLPIAVCDYQWFRMGGSTIIVGDIESIVYGDNGIIGEEGTLRRKCFYKGEVECRLREMFDIPGRVISTRELLRQLKGY